MPMSDLDLELAARDLRLIRESQQRLLASIRQAIEVLEWYLALNQRLRLSPVHQRSAAAHVTEAEEELAALRALATRLEADGAGDAVDPQPVSAGRA